MAHELVFRYEMLAIVSFAKVFRLLTCFGLCFNREVAQICYSKRGDPKRYRSPSGVNHDMRYDNELDNQHISQAIGNQFENFYGR